MSLCTQCFSEKPSQAPGSLHPTPQLMAGPGFSPTPLSDGEPLKPLTPGTLLSLSILFPYAEWHTALLQFLSPSVTYCYFQGRLEIVFETSKQKISSVPITCLHT